MPPLPRELQAKDAGEALAELPEGEYCLSVSSIWKAFAVAEGGIYFATGGKVFTVWAANGKVVNLEKPSAVIRT